MTKCSTCNAVYMAVQPDGVRYFHRCAQVAGASPVTVQPQANERNENVPAPATLAPIIAAIPTTADVGAYWKQVNATRETAAVAVGAGVALTIDPGNVVATPS